MQNSANPNDFLKNDVIGALENVDDVNNLTSIKTQGKIQFGAEISNIDAATELRLTLDNVEKVFTLGDLASSISNYSVLAEYLNSVSLDLMETISRSRILDFMRAEIFLR